MTEQTETGAQAPASGRRGVVARMAGVSVWLAIAVFLFNMAAVWVVVWEATRIVGEPLSSSAGTVPGAVFDALQGQTNASPGLLGKALNLELLMKTVQNQHTILILALGTAFSLMAIGFALYVMGADGAFSMQGDIGNHGNLVIKSTAPGLACFVLATVTVVAVITADFKVVPSSFSETRTVSQGAPPGRGPALNQSGSAGEKQQNSNSRSLSADDVDDDEDIPPPPDEGCPDGEECE